MNSFINKVGKWIKESSFGLILTTVAVVFVVCVGIIVSSHNDLPVNHTSNSIQAVESDFASSSDEIESSSTEVVKEKVMLPFTVDAKIAKYFFDTNDSIDIKSQALINYDNKFVPSLGVAYTYDNKPFTVVSSFKGKVVEKYNDSLYGLTIVIENEEGLRAHYCGLSNVNVYLDENIKQGQMIGKTGESVIHASLGNHLHFAIELNDKFINPLKVFDKNVNEII